MSATFEALGWINLVGWACILWIVLGRLAERFGTTRFRLLGVVLLVGALLDALSGRDDHH